MFKKKVLLGVSAALLATTSFSITAHAVDEQIDASIVTRAAISVTKNADMDFGTVEYSATHGGLIQLGTNGTAVLSGATGLTLNGGTATAGNVSVSGDGNSIVEISCTDNGTLAAVGGDTLPLSAVEFTTGAGGAPGAGTACAGLGDSPGTVDLSATPAPTILMGGTLDVSGNAITQSATYSTTNGSGVPVTLRVVYQ